MKKLYIDRLLIKLGNIEVCLMDEIEHIDKNSHSSGMYNINDLTRISNYANAIMRDVKNNVDEHTYANFKYLCECIIKSCERVIKQINEEDNYETMAKKQ